MINDPVVEFIEKNQELSPKADEHLITLYLNRVRREGGIAWVWYLRKYFLSVDLFLTWSGGKT